MHDVRAMSVMPFNVIGKAVCLHCLVWTKGTKLRAVEGRGMEKGRDCRMVD